MSADQTNPETEVAKNRQLTMFDVMFGSEEKATNPEQASEEEQASDIVEDVVEEEELSATEEEYDDGEVGEVVEEQEDSETESPRYTVKVDGKEFEVTLDELRNGYQRQSDYTRKSQSLAEQRKAYESNLQAVQQEREQYSQVLANMAQYQNLELQKYNEIDWVSLKENDPMEYMEKRLEYQDAREKQAQIQAEQQRMYDQNRREFQEVVTRKVQEEAKALSKVLPEYADPNSNLKNDLRNYALGLGFSQQDIDAITDHRVVLVLHKAMMNDRASKTSEKKLKVVPKVVKSGTPESKAQRSNRERQAKRERLSQTGNIRDAVSVFLDIMDQSTNQTNRKR